MTASSELYEAIGAQGKDWCACQKRHAERKRLLAAHRAEVLEEAALALEAEAERGQKMGVTRITMRADARRVRELAAGEG